MNYESLDSVLETVMAAVRRCETFLGPDDDWVEDDRRILYEAAQRLLTPLTGHDFVRKKGLRDYVTTAHARPDSSNQGSVESALQTQHRPDVVEAALVEAGYQRNLASTRKYRIVDGSKQWAVGSWVYDPADTAFQHHVYLFNTPPSASGTDLYGHREVSVREGAEHLTDTSQEHGDPNGRARTALDQLDIPYSTRDIHE